MRNYKLEVTLLAKFSIEAASREEAERIVRGVCEGGTVRVTETADNEEFVEGTCEIEGDID